MIKKKTPEQQARKNRHVRRSSHGKFATVQEMMEAGAKRKGHPSVDKMKTAAYQKGKTELDRQQHARTLRFQTRKGKKE